MRMLFDSVMSIDPHSVGTIQHQVGETFSWQEDGSLSEIKEFPWMPKILKNELIDNASNIYLISLLIGDSEQIPSPVPLIIFSGEEHTKLKLNTVSRGDWICMQFENRGDVAARICVSLQ